MADYQGAFGREFEGACREIRALLNAIDATTLSARIEIHLKEIEGLARKYRNLIKTARLQADTTAGD